MVVGGGHRRALVVGDSGARAEPDADTRHRSFEAISEGAERKENPDIISAAAIVATMAAPRRHRVENRRSCRSNCSSLFETLGEENQQPALHALVREQARERTSGWAGASADDRDDQQEVRAIILLPRRRHEHHCSATSSAAFNVSITLNDSRTVRHQESCAADRQGPQLPEFLAKFGILLKDGQTAQYVGHGSRQRNAEGHAERFEVERIGSWNPGTDPHNENRGWAFVNIYYSLLSGGFVFQLSLASSSLFRRSPGTCAHI
jgi:hypothetical protein